MSDVIRLLDSSGTNVLDSVSTDYEDSFCLETFGDLISMHRESEPKGTKEFIIARVQTWDHKQPEKAFYSYYSAYQLNKILIKTQKYKGKRLIHRLHVLNPLTNTDIIGNVQYFMVKSQSDAKESENEANPAETLQPVEVTSVPEPVPAPQEMLQVLQPPIPTDNEGDEGLPSSPIGPLPPPMMKPARKRPTSLSIKTGPHSLPRPARRNSDLIIPPSPSVKQVEAGTATSWTMSAPSAVEAPDDEPLLAGDRKADATGEEAKQQPRKKSIFSNIMSPRRKSVAPGTPKKMLSMRLRAFSDKSTPQAHAPSQRRHHSAGDAYHPTTTTPPLAQPPMSAFPTTHPDATKVPVPAGNVTRFAVPVPIEELTSLPPTSRNRRRTLSYHNAVTAAGTHASFEDWLHMVTLERKAFKRKGSRSDAGEEYDVVRPFGRASLVNKGLRISTPKLDTIRGSPPAKQTGDINQSAPTTPKNEQEQKEEEHEQDDETESTINIYDAILFATDIDFLESSKVRAIFRENAVTPDDAKLFELPPVPAESPSPTSPRRPPVSPDEPLCFCC
ncbi:uncharacterized protein SPPG_05789 [Spizellomyces punctatus DAOM BR117]|uniref:Uncharacterized protein n=1 Tax=Spizellomyces punctatus (strain DAOM BR117) TaxID=645134 RepID=A0A0L0HCA0_SPIPD|nr:uncharacterized protein SPPG_05789 [Spizellomyces punctatus DAOM BR117]KNC98812.1 hypothetical protein SPPG_05789 [Spizellomyces punctatus DAOM BR117]|eukprot:XP_016606852.1 hypothetical protein SPPG_05789 [Spizellomyces punctatus DAOM BR117]